MKRFFLILLLYPIFQDVAQNNILDSLLKDMPSELADIIEHPDEYRFQLIYTKICYFDHQVFFEDYYFHYSDTLYNYPASMVKLPASVIAVKKTEDLKNDQIDWNNKVSMDSLFCQPALRNDSVGFPFYPHLKKWIKRMLIVSDNTAYTHTYDYLNCRTLHTYLKHYGFEKARIQHKFISKCINDSTYYTPSVYVLNDNNDTLYIQYADSACKFQSSEKNYTVGYTVKKIKKRKKVIRRKESKTFVKHNDWPLAYSHQLMKYLIFDKSLKILSLNDAHRDSLIRFMGAYPREYPDLMVNTNDYYDTWKKFFIYGGKYKTIQQDTLRNINIIGRAYGFLSETAYIVDFKNGVDFILSASIYVNPNNIMDGKYDYEKAYQLFYHISQRLYEYEKKYNSKNITQFKYYENLFQQH
ncbi:MAG: hypothetical protein Fur0023_08240 [Bacteroidia bacterium]